MIARIALPTDGVETGKVMLYEDGSQNVYGLVYDKDGNLVNIVSGIDRLQPLPFNALVTAARQGFPFAAQWLAVEHSGVTMEEEEARLQDLNKCLAVIPMSNALRCWLYPEAADSAGKQFLIRWFF